MKRTALLVLTIALSLSACIPALPSLGPADEPPAIDAQATDQALAATMAVETLNALPTPTLEPATATLEPTETLATTPTPSVEATETLTPDPNATATETLTPDPNATPSVTGTSETPTATVTGTLPTSTATATGTLSTSTPSPTLSPTATETLHARFFGTQPPNLPSGKVKLINKSKAEVYISMQGTTADGYTTISEYPVDGRMRVSVPAASYFYVAWVGGKQFKGYFNLRQGDEVSITFEKNKVTAK